jgi:hypothetical protein
MRAAIKGTHLMDILPVKIFWEVGEEEDPYEIDLIMRLKGAPLNFDDILAKAASEILEAGGDLDSEFALAIGTFRVGDHRSSG